jgi:hypothetical protein
MPPPAAIFAAGRALDFCQSMRIERSRPPLADARGSVTGACANAGSIAMVESLHNF